MLHSCEIVYYIPIWARTKLWIYIK